MFTLLNMQYKYEPGWKLNMGVCAICFTFHKASQKNYAWCNEFYVVEIKYIYNGITFY